MAIEVHRHPLLDKGAVRGRRRSRPALPSTPGQIAGILLVNIAPALWVTGVLGIVSAPLIIHSAGQAAVRRADARAHSLDRLSVDTQVEGTFANDINEATLNSTTLDAWAVELGMERAGPAQDIGR